MGRRHRRGERRPLFNSLVTVRRRGGRFDPLAIVRKSVGHRHPWSEFEGMYPWKYGRGLFDKYLPSKRDYYRMRGIVIN